MTTRPPSLAERIVQLEDQIKRMNLIGIALTAERSLSVLLDRIVREARSLVNADAGSLYIVAGDELSFEVAQNASLERAGKLEPFKAFRIPKNVKSIAGYVAARGEVVVIRDVYALPPNVPYGFNRSFDERTGYRTKSILAVPMRDHEEQILGVLQLINKLDASDEVAPFDTNDRDLSYSLASQAAVAISNVRLIKELKTTFHELVTYCGVLVDARSRHTAGHTVRVAEYTMRLAEAINRAREGPLGGVTFTTDQLEEIYIAAYMHDIGKIAVREAVLDKENKLTPAQTEAVRNRFHYIRERRCRELLERMVEGAPEERARIREELEQQRREIDEDLKFIVETVVPTVVAEDRAARLKAIAAKRYVDSEGREQPYLTDFEYENLSILRGSLTAKERKEIEDHVVKSIEILSRIPFPKHLSQVPVYAGGHHEKMDGTGYPRGLKADQLPLPARMIALCDFFDALTSYDRPYKKPVPVERSFAILEDEARKGKIDPGLLEMFHRERLYEGIAEEAAKPPDQRKHPDGIEPTALKRILSSE